MATDSGLAKVSSTAQQASPWDAALEKLREWDPAFIVRKVAVDKTRSSLEKALASIKQKLESQAQ